MKYLVVMLLLVCSPLAAQNYQPTILPATGSTLHTEVGTTVTGTAYRFEVRETNVSQDMHLAYSDPVVWTSSTPTGVTVEGPTPGSYTPQPPTWPYQTYYSKGAVGVPQIAGTYPFELTYYWYDSVAIGAGASTASETRSYTLVVHPTGTAPMLGWETSTTPPPAGSGGEGGGGDSGSGCTGELGESYAFIPVLTLLMIFAGLYVLQRYLGGDGHDDSSSSSLRVAGAETDGEPSRIRQLPRSSREAGSTHDPRSR